MIPQLSGDWTRSIKSRRRGWWSIRDSRRDSDWAGPAISSKHALALINPGNAPGEARAADIIELKDAIQRGVESAWGIRLIAEPVLVGF